MARCEIAERRAERLKTEGAGADDVRDGHRRETAQEAIRALRSLSPVQATLPAGVSRPGWRS